LSPFRPAVKVSNHAVPTQQQRWRNVDNCDTNDTIASRN
jgi:hypothetical protein